MNEPLLLLPGLSCDAASWADVVARLGDVAGRVVELPDEDSLGRIAERVLAAAPPRFALAGHSMGGRVALEIVRRAPARVTRLALLDTGFTSLPDGDAGRKEREHRHALLALAREQGMVAMARAWTPPMVHPSRLADTAFVDAILAMIARSNPERFARQVAALLDRPDATSVLVTIRCPTLVLCGREDGWAGVAQHEAMTARIAGARLVIVERCGHMAPMEQPLAVAEALRGLLAVPITIFADVAAN